MSSDLSSPQSIDSQLLPAGDTSGCSSVDASQMAVVNELFEAIRAESLSGKFYCASKYPFSDKQKFALNLNGFTPAAVLKAEVAGPDAKEELYQTCIERQVKLKAKVVAPRGVAPRWIPGVICNPGL